jgi:hypothetical protein
VRVSRFYQSCFLLLLFFSGSLRPQLRAPDLSGHCRTSAKRQGECQKRFQKECQKDCQNVRRKVCQNGCQMECQIECQSISQKECQIECQNKYAIYIYIRFQMVSQKPCQNSGFRVGVIRFSSNVG